MSKVIYYNDCFDFTEEDIIVLDKQLAETEDLVDYIKESEIRPKKVYELIDMEKNQKILILNFIKHYENRDELIVDIDSRLIDFFNAFTLLIHSVNEFNACEYKKRKDNLLTIYTNEIEQFSKISLLFDLYDKFLDDIALPITLKTPFLYHDLDDIKTKHWIEYDFSNITGISEILSKLNEHKNVPHFDLEQLKFIYEKIENFKVEIEKYNHYDTNKKIFMISAYFFSLAEYFFDKEEFNISLIFIHRSVDLYVQYYAKTISGTPIIRFNNRQLEYSNNSSDHIYLNETLKRIRERSGHMVYTTHQEFLDNLNDSRRFSLLSHSIFSIEKETVFRYMTDTKQLIEIIEGDTWWEDTKFIFRFENLFNESNLFIFESSLDTYFQEISV